MLCIEGNKENKLKNLVCQNYQCKLVDWNLFNVITEQCNFSYPHLGMQKPINITVNIFHSFPTICTTCVSSSRHLAQTAVSGISSGVFSRASPRLYLCWEHGELWPAQPTTARWQWREHLSALIDLWLSFEPHKPSSPSRVWLRLNDAVDLAWVWVI